MTTRSSLRLKILYVADSKLWHKVAASSIEDEDMRHGRKSHSQKFDGYKRHVLQDLELQMVRAVGVLVASAPLAMTIRL